MKISKPTYKSKCKNIGYLPMTISKLNTQGKILFQEGANLKEKYHPKSQTISSFTVKNRGV